MLQLVSLFGMGCLISFLGSLPLGTLNITAMQIAIEEKVRNAILFAVGVALVELIYVRISLKGIGWIMAHEKVFYYMEWATVALFLVLAFSSFWVARKKTGAAKNVLLNNKVNRFWLGVSMSAINPVQIPFWFMWSSSLFSMKLLRAEALHFNVYTAGIALGTVSGLLLFIYGGKWLVNRLNASQRMIQVVVGMVFLITAIIQLVRVVNKPMQERIQTTTSNTK